MSVEIKARLLAPLRPELAGGSGAVAQVELVSVYVVFSVCDRLLRLAGNIQSNNFSNQL